MSLRNMKFRVSSPAQSEALQSVLFSLGYNTEVYNFQKHYTDTAYVFASHTGMVYLDGATTCITNCDGVLYEDADTEAFIEQHAHNAANILAANAKLSARSLEDAYDQHSSENIFETAKGPDEHPCPWQDNTGECPVEDGNTLVDVVLQDEVGCSEDYVHTPLSASSYRWDLSGTGGDIVKWRYSHAEDYFKQPKTAPKHNGDEGYLCPAGKAQKEYQQAILENVPADEAVAIDSHPDKGLVNFIDKHYNFTYELTEKDIEAGQIKLDPYFIAQQWKLGSKDDSGVVWHIFKTCARFGVKNDKAREITAIYKSIKRLAELEGVTL